MKSILIFQKWTKKMSKIEISKTLLLTKNFVYIEKNYGVVLNENIKKLLAYFFIFFVEKYLGIFSVALVS